MDWDIEFRSCGMMYFRNKEVKIISVIILAITIFMSAISFTIDIRAGAMVLTLAVLLYLVFNLFTIRRYRDLNDLSEYLRRVSSGDYSLDIRDNKEGELSILKSEIYKVTLMLTEYNEQLQGEKVLLSEQMAEISHQLKTPLTSMMMMVDLLSDDNLPGEKRREFSNLINSQLERIDWLVASLLKMSKLEAGVVTMKKEKVSATGLIDRVLKPFLIAMEIKGISYSSLINCKEIICDDKWTSEAIINILKNCIEHTNEGGHIELQARDNPLYYEILISDNGVGIKKEDLPHIFTRFYRGQNASSDSVGIGLAMSYRIIKSQKGDILVKSQIGKGSTFSVRLYKSII